MMSKSILVQLSSHCWKLNHWRARLTTDYIRKSCGFSHKPFKVTVPEIRFIRFGEGTWLFSRTSDVSYAHKLHSSVLLLYVRKSTSCIYMHAKWGLQDKHFSVKQTRWKNGLYKCYICWRKTFILHFFNVSLVYLEGVLHIQRWVFENKFNLVTLDHLKFDAFQTSFSILNIRTNVKFIMFLLK